MLWPRIGMASPQVVRLPHHDNPYVTYVDTNPVIKLVNRASAGSSILIITHKFDNSNLFNSIVRAVRRNINIGIITDYADIENNYGYFRALKTLGADIFINNSIQDTNFIIIDSFYTITGTKELHNLVVYHNSTISSIYINEFIKHYQNSIVWR